MIYPPADFFGKTNGAAPVVSITGVIRPIYSVSSNLSLKNTIGLDVTAIDIDATFAGNSDTALATQAATKTYVDTSIGILVQPTYIAPIVYEALGNTLSLVADLAQTITRIDSSMLLVMPATTAIPTSLAVKAFVEDAISNISASAPMNYALNNISLINSALAAITSISTDSTFAANSDVVIPTQKAVRIYSNAISGNTPVSYNPTTRKISLTNVLVQTITSIDTSMLLVAPSNLSLPTTAAVKGYADAQVDNITATSPVIYNLRNLKLVNSAASNITSISTDTTLAANLDTTIATQKATKAYVDTAIAGVVTPYLDGVNTFVRDNVLNKFTFTCNSSTICTLKEANTTFMKPVVIDNGLASVKFTISAGASENTIQLSTNDNLILTTPRYNSINMLPCINPIAPAVAWAAITGTSFYGFKFTTAELYMAGSIQPPHNISATLPVTIYLRVINIGVVSGVTNWITQYQIIAKDAVLLSSASDVVSDYPYTRGTTNLKQLCIPICTIPARAWLPCDSLMFKVGRGGAADTYAGNEFMVGLSFEYGCNKISGDHISAL